VSRLGELRALVKVCQQELHLARNYDATKTAERHIASARKRVAAETEVVLGKSNMELLWAGLTSSSVIGFA
jgi:hypothetical protein